MEDEEGLCTRLEDACSSGNVPKIRDVLSDIVEKQKSVERIVAKDNCICVRKALQAGVRQRSFDALRIVLPYAHAQFRNDPGLNAYLVDAFSESNGIDQMRELYDATSGLCITDHVTNATLFRWFYEETPFLRTYLERSRNMPQNNDGLFQCMHVSNRESNFTVRNVKLDAVVLDVFEELAGRIEDALRYFDENEEGTNNVSVPVSMQLIRCVASTGHMDSRLFAACFRRGLLARSTIPCLLECFPCVDLRKEVGDVAPYLSIRTRHTVRAIATHIRRNDEGYTERCKIAVLAALSDRLSRDVLELILKDPRTLGLFPRSMPTIPTPSNEEYHSWWEELAASVVNVRSPNGPIRFQTRSDPGDNVDIRYLFDPERVNIVACCDKETERRVPLSRSTHAILPLSRSRKRRVTHTYLPAVKNTALFRTTLEPRVYFFASVDASDYAHDTVFDALGQSVDENVRFLRHIVLVKGRRLADMFDTGLDKRKRNVLMSDWFARYATAQKDGEVCRKILLLL
jgi:hypothetical protein